MSTLSKRFSAGFDLFSGSGRIKVQGESIGGSLHALLDCPSPQNGSIVEEEISSTAETLYNTAVAGTG